MSQIPTEEVFNTPKFVREREAWYKAGAGKMTVYTAISVFVVGLVAGYAGLFFGFDSLQVAMSVVFGTWISMFAINIYIDITARQTASQGGVDVDRF